MPNVIKIVNISAGCQRLLTWLEKRHEGIRNDLIEKMRETKNFGSVGATTLASYEVDGMTVKFIQFKSTWQKDPCSLRFMCQRDGMSLTNECLSLNGIPESLKMQHFAEMDNNFAATDLVETDLLEGIEVIFVEDIKVGADEIKTNYSLDGKWTAVAETWELKK